MPANRRRPDRPVRESSIKVQDSWKLLENLDFVRLSKLSYDVEEPVDLYVHYSSFAFFGAEVGLQATCRVHVK